MDELLTVPGAETLKVSAGEHLAAILLTAFCGTPTSIDQAGEVDLTFQLPSGGTGKWLFGDHVHAAVEIKSLPGRWREQHQYMDDGRQFQARVRSAADILEEASEVIAKAVAQLRRKLPTTGWSRHVFLAVHLFDGLAVEVFSEEFSFAHLLPELDVSVGLDTLWVLWHPDHLVVWSQAERRWSGAIEAGYSFDDPRSNVADEEEESPIIRAERRYLAATGRASASPWAFKLATPDDEA